MDTQDKDRSEQRINDPEKIPSEAPVAITPLAPPRLSNEAVKPPGPGPPPNGGTKAWLQVLGAFFLNFNTWGLVNTFGVFQSYYATTLLRSSSESDISWIGSIQAFIMLAMGVVCGRALDAGYFYTELGLGVFLEVFGLMMTSLCTEYWQAVLAHGLAVGLGTSLAFMPGVSIAGTYFSTRRSTAMGILATGSCIGGIIYPLVLKHLIAEIGFPWAVRVMAFIVLATMLISLAVMKPRLPPRKSGPLVNVRAFTDPPFTLWLAAVFLTMIGLYIPFFYVEQFALSIGVDPDLASYMVIIMNAASMPGRLFPSMIADRAGNLNIMIPSVLLSGVIMLAWTRIETQGALIAVSILFGFSSGAIQAVLPPSVAFLMPDLSQLGTNLGITLFSAAFGVLIGNPVAGAILGHQSTANLEFPHMFIFAGVVVLLGGLLFMGVRTLKVGLSLNKA
ncbi:putative monocarboxylate permease [Thozetella sp. PMI_491]|nr:putative monocarboxylate permease [Thozetella sp. PMI_491]